MATIKILIPFVLIILIINESYQSANLNQLETELRQFDQLLGVVLNQKQEKLWERETSNKEGEIFDPEAEIYFYDLFSDWASDRYFRLMQCHLPTNQHDNQQQQRDRICEYLQKVLQRFSNGSTKNLNFATVELSILLKQLQHAYKNLNGIFYKGKLYFGEDSVNKLMSKVKDEKELKKIWDKWSQIVGQMAPSFQEIAERLSENNRGFDLWNHWNADLGIEPTDSALPLAEKLWSQVEPFYQLLFDYLKSRINPNGSSSSSSLLPIHLLHSFSASELDQLYDTAKPYHFIAEESPLPRSISNLSELIIRAQAVYRDFGFDPLPEKFWEQSRFSVVNETDTADVDESCHPLTFDFFLKRDVRTSMCIQDFGPGTWRRMIHELGHVYYFMAYGRQMNLFKLGPNSAVHEAVGESVFLAQNGCRAKSNDQKELINRLFQEALTSFVRIPYGLALELWRFEALTSSGVKTPDLMNQRYWNIRSQIQGFGPVDEGELKLSNRLDPLSKYHVTNFVPYLRYFFGTFLAHQIQRNLCFNEKGEILANCCPNGEAMDRFRKFLSNGVSGNANSNWNLLTEGRENWFYRAEPLLEYYAPLIEWLKLWKIGQQI